MLDSFPSKSQSIISAQIAVVSNAARLFPLLPVPPDLKISTKSKYLIQGMESFKEQIFPVMCTPRMLMIEIVDESLS